MGSLLPPVRRPRCGRAKWLCPRPPSKQVAGQDSLGKHRQLGRPRQAAGPFPLEAPLRAQASEVQGLPLAATPPSLTLGAGPGRSQRPQLPQGRGSRQPSSPCTGSLPGDPTRTNSRPRMLPDRGVVLWDAVLGAILSCVPVTVSPHPQKEARSSGRVQQPRAQTLVPPAQKQPAGPLSKPSVSPLSHNFYIYQTSLGFKIGPVSVRHRDG